jgi:CRISPR-associated endonuclease/helicase Cas3
MKPSPYPDWLDDVWAKSPEKGEVGQGESLAQHTWAVVSRLAEFAYLRPSLAQEQKRPDLWNLLFWTAMFHDFGKTVPAFQAVLRAKVGAKEVWQRNRHEVFSLAFLPWIAGNFTNEQMQWIHAGVAFHHREPEEIDQHYRLPPDCQEEPLEPLIREIDETTLIGLRRWIVECTPDWIINLKLNELGVQVVSLPPEKTAVELIQWNGTRNIRKGLVVCRRFIEDLDEQRPDRSINPLLLRGHVLNADHGGSAHVGPTQRYHLSAEEVYQKCNIDQRKLFDHQSRANNTIGSALLSAPTGSGKTEASLLWTACQCQSGNPPPRLFYTLPYQASMNAMKKRLGNVFGEEQVSLQHGRGLLALYRQLMERGYSPDEAASAARQMKDLAKLNHTPVRVFSPYQMLKAMYRLKGYEAQLADYQNSLFIFDEIHAYEVKRLAMILSTIQYLRENYQARFFIMSATFPTLIRDWLQEALKEAVPILAEAAVYQDFQRHQLDLIEGDLLVGDHLASIAKEAKLGKSILVVCNTVARAEKAYTALSTSLSGYLPVRLLHGRFNMRDRMEKEKFIQDVTGTKSLTRTPAVLVATQVVEVSLDIDFNTIYTDPAPFEALIQRFGRVNRGRSIKPYAPVHVFTQPDDGHKIYDPELIHRTLEILQKIKGKPIDEAQIGTWLDEIYDGEIAERWKREFEDAKAEFDAICVRTLRPFHSAGSDMEDRFNKMFDGVEVLPESLFAEYQNTRENEPIAANELLVPIRWGQYHALINKGLMKPGDRQMPPVVMTSYDSDSGLSMERQNNDDEWD